MSVTKFLHINQKKRILDMTYALVSKNEMEECIQKNVH